MNTKGWSGILVGLAMAGAALGYLANEALRLTPREDIAFIISAVAAGIGGMALLLAFRNVVQLRRTAEPTGQHHTEEKAPNPLTSPVTAVLRCLDAPVAVIGERGGISALNPRAIALLAPYAVAGGSIFKVLEREDLNPALHRARGSHGPVTAQLRRHDGGTAVTARVSDLGLHTGAVLVFDAPADSPPLPGTVLLRPGGTWGPAHDPDQALAAMPMVALVLEQQVGHVRTIRTVRLTGGRMFPTLSLDFTVAPPDAAGAIAAGRPLGEIWPILADALHGTAVIAENALSGWAVLAADLTANGLPVPEVPPLIELSALLHAYDPAMATLSADEAAAALHIAETDPGRRLARVAAHLAMGRDGGGLGPVGQFLCAAQRDTADHGGTGEAADNALQPASNGSGASDAGAEVDADK